MRFVEVGGVRLSAIGLGTWQFGSGEWGYGPDYAATEALRIVDRALDLGINVIDTAEVYGAGASERIVGNAVAGRRADVFLATKVLPVLAVASIVEQRGRASAERLGVDSIDLYQVHFPNPLVPLASTMRGLRSLQQAGVVSHVGVSNFSAGRWAAAERRLGAPVLSNQVRYSLVTRKAERAVLPHAQRHDRLMIAYSPLAQGLLSGRYDAGNRPGGVRRANPLFLPGNIGRVRPVLDALDEVARAHGASASQVALAWVIRRPNVVAIPGASSVAQLEANAAAADLVLTEEQDHRLTEASDRFRPRRGPVAWPAMAVAALRR